MTIREDDAWLRRARDLLDESTQSLDGATESRLNRARQAALASQRPRTVKAWRGFAALGASALAVAIAVGLQRPPAEPSPPPGEAGANRIAVADEGEDDLLAAEDLEFLEELDFYQWLDREGLSTAVPESESRRPL